MIYTIRRNSSDPLLIGAAAITFLFIFYVLFLGEIQVSGSGSFQINLQGFSLTSSSFLQQFSFILPFMAILGFSKTFMDIMEDGNLFLILSKPISRSEFILKNIGGIIILTVLYTAGLVFLFLMLFLIKSQAIPYQFLTAILFFPIGILALYSIILFCSLLMNSYAVTVFLTFIYTFVIHPWLLNPDMLTLFGVNSSILTKFVNVTTLIVPNTFGAINLMNDWLDNDVTLVSILAILISSIPFFFLSVYIMNKKEF